MRTRRKYHAPLSERFLLMYMGVLRTCLSAMLCSALFAAAAGAFFAVFHGELRATTLGHHVVSIQRDDVIVWMRQR